MVSIPNGVSVDVTGPQITVKGPKGSVTKSFSRKISLEKSGNELVVRADEKEKALIGTVTAIVEGMVKGVTELYTKKYKALYAHFPITIEVKANGIIIKNFLGEKNPRKAKIAGDTKVEAKGQFVTISGPDKEAVGQTLANLKAALKIKRKDSRVFQDGVYEVVE